VFAGKFGAEAGAGIELFYLVQGEFGHYAFRTRGAEYGRVVHDDEMAVLGSSHVHLDNMSAEFDGLFEGADGVLRREPNCAAMSHGKHTGPFIMPDAVFQYADDTRDFRIDFGLVPVAADFPGNAESGTPLQVAFSRFKGGCAWHHAFEEMKRVGRRELEISRAGGPGIAETYVQQ
jgi:hypothetical protein